MGIVNKLAFTGFLVLILKMLLLGQDGDGSWIEMRGYSRVLFVWGMIGGVFLWVSMLVDHLKYSRVKNKVAWGLVLIFGQILAACVYYVFVYLKAPKHLTGS